MVKTLENIIQDLSGFSYSHAQINDFGKGRISNITTKNHKYPMIWLQPTTSIIDERMITLNMDMYVLDIVKQDLSNLIQVQSDMLVIGSDFVTNFWDNEETYSWTMVENVQGEFFDAEFDDYCAGSVFKISLEIENRMNICEIPLR